MSDPQPAPGKRVPQRAEPLQPDSPGRGDERGTMPGVDIDNAAVTSAEDEKSGAKDRPSSEESQVENAIKNTTEGYK